MVLNSFLVSETIYSKKIITLNMYVIHYERKLIMTSLLSTYRFNFLQTVIEHTVISNNSSTLNEVTNC